MLRTEAALGPAAAVIEFNPQEIANFPKHTVFYFPTQLAIGVRNMQRRTERNRPIYLQTSPGKGNILQISHPPAGPSVRILPLDVYQIRTQHSGLNSAIHHNLLVLSDSQ